MKLTGKKISRKPTQSARPKTIEERTKELQSQKAYLQTQKDVLARAGPFFSMNFLPVLLVSGFKDAICLLRSKIVWDSVGKDTVQKVVDKKLGLNKQSTSEKLAQQAKDLKNMYDIKDYKSKLILYHLYFFLRFFSSSFA